MKIIDIIKDDDFNIKTIPFNNPRIRFSSRGIILNKEGQIALLLKVNKNEYKLIGGGIENNEKPEEAFIRESLEECGCNIEIQKFLGKIIEEKSQDNFIQESYVFVATVKNDNKQLSLTLKEKEEGSKLVWTSLKEAIYLIENCESFLKPSKYENLYHSKFIIRRDAKILKYYMKIK